jgi:hypothetical protein
MKQDATKYCNFLLAKLSHYIKLVHKVETIRMVAEFLIDEFDYVWLVSASEIWIRQEILAPTDHNKMFS